MNTKYIIVFVSIIFISTVSYIVISKNAELTDNVRLQQDQTNKLLASLQIILDGKSSSKMFECIHRSI